ncbi:MULTISPECIES: benzoate/H(+) symporter BenE family transporter [Deefgea]|uniref:Benzoate/H(+) symporter BenE family transporter n=1 Tax=Deefgea chitinilytica TaxID=570276 RepID=A0ABS2CBS0_9NEIS|nr:MULTISPECIES: benzoate/H(+) symporter BenE family transporter [Deefgea]MBM5571527.1 benzoate/H(+) symporter BenE family transporter [Deefgea chitinilytica]MBM9888760.1 benzoate/H(+) symporter BenE family transporter [Deefgea sp. CFH1-16]
MSFWRDGSMSAVVAGFVTVLVGFTSSAVIVFQAAQALHATPEQIASWMWALGLAMGLTCIGLSLRFRVPVVTAWSTPGAALLVTGVAGVTMPEAIGAFIVSGLLIVLMGVTGWFERAMQRIPLGIASAMLAGVLLRFGMGAFTALQTQLLLAGSMIASYLLLRRFLPRYAIVGVLLCGLLISAAQGLLHLEGIRFELAQPIWIMPEFTLSSIASVALPLFMVTMASQNVPGVTVLRANGYTPPISPIIATTGLTTVLLAPFGAFAINLAAITAAICMGKDAHEDASKRYVAAVAAGVFYVLIGLFGATVAALFAAFPRELVLVVAGLALVNIIGNGLALAMRDETQREAAMMTFLVTASGLTLFGIGSAFWGLIAGALTAVVMHKK